MILSIVFGITTLGFTAGFIRACLKEIDGDCYVGLGIAAFISTILFLAVGLR